MRVALPATAALVLTAVPNTAQTQHTTRLQQLGLDQRGRLNEPHRLGPIWTRRGEEATSGFKRHVRSATPCHPDVGILSSTPSSGSPQCGEGYWCQPMLTESVDGSLGGYCVPNQLARELEDRNPCVYFESLFGDYCDCSQWDSEVGSMECLVYTKNTTYYGLDMIYSYYGSFAVTDNGYDTSTRFCFKLNEPTESLESYCFITNRRFSNGSISEPLSCEARVNGEVCSSCNLVPCSVEDDNSVREFDCSNIVPEVVKVDVCGVNETLWEDVLTGSQEDGSRAWSFHFTLLALPLLAFVVPIALV